MDIPHPDPDAEAMLDESGVIARDTPCRRCSYNLRGLSPEHRCPECGTPVGLSCHGDLLRFADPGWVETLARGCSLILWGILFNLLGGILGGVLTTLSGTPVLGSAIQMAAGLVGLYGAWLVTSPDPSGLGEDKYVTDRRIVRFALLVGVCAQFISLLVEGVPMATALKVFLGVVVLVAGLVGVVGEFAKLTYFEKLARRIPHPKLAQDARTLRWAMAITLGAVVLFGALMAISMVASGVAAGTAGVPPGTLAGGVAFGCLTGVAGLAYLIVSVLVLILISRLGKAFRQQARDARETWAATAAAPVS